jgi:hypothetical protein
VIEALRDVGSIGVHAAQRIRRRDDGVALREKTRKILSQLADSAEEPWTTTTVGLLPRPSPAAANAGRMTAEPAARSTAITTARGGDAVIHRAMRRATVVMTFSRGIDAARTSGG